MKAFFWLTALINAVWLVLVELTLALSPPSPTLEGALDLGYPVGIADAVFVGTVLLLMDSLKNKASTEKEKLHFNWCLGLILFGALIKLIGYSSFPDTASGIWQSVGNFFLLVPIGLAWALTGVSNRK